MPTRLPPETQTTLAGYWTHALEGMSAEILAALLRDEVPVDIVRGWIELVRHIPRDMLRPREPSSYHWHARLARHCLDWASLGDYALRHRVQHCLLAESGVEAAQALGDFDYLYHRLSLGHHEAARIWREVQQARSMLSGTLLGRELAEWENFWRGRQFLLGEFRPQLTFLSLADGYAEDSVVSQAARVWLQERGPDSAWLRHRFRPSRPYDYPLILDARPAGGDALQQVLLCDGGRKAAVLTRQGEITLWDLVRGEPLTRLPGQQGRNSVMAVQGQTLVVAQDSQIRLFDLDGGGLLRRFRGEPSATPCVAVGGQRLFWAGQDSHVAVWDLATEQALSWLAGPAGKSISQLVICPEGKKLTALWADGSVGRWDLDDQAHALRFHGNSARPWGQSWADGRVLVSSDGRQRLEMALNRSLVSPSLEAVEEWCEGGAWAIVRGAGRWHCWNLDEASRLASWGPAAAEGRLGLSPSGELVVQARFAGAPPLVQLGRPERVRVDGNLRCAVTWQGRDLVTYDLESGQILAHLKGHRDEVLQADLSLDGRRVVSVARDQSLRVWDSSSGKQLRQVNTQARAVGVNPDGTRAVTGAADGSVRLWDLQEGSCIAVLDGHDREVDWAIWTDSDWMITGSCHCFRIWDPARIFRAELARPVPVVFQRLSPCGRYAYGHRDHHHFAVVQDLDRGYILSSLNRVQATPVDEVFSPEGNRLVVATREGLPEHSVSLRVWEVVAPEPLTRFRLPPLTLHTEQDPEDTTGGSVLTCDENWVAARCQDGQIRIWPLQGQAPPGHDSSVLCWQQEGRRLVTGSVDKTARLWDLDSGRCLQVLPAGDSWVEGLHLCGHYVGVESGRHKMLWDLPRGTHQRVTRFPEKLSRTGRALSRVDERYLELCHPRNPSEGLLVGPQENLVAFDFSGDGRRLASCSGDGELCLWGAGDAQKLGSWQTGLKDVVQLEWVDNELVTLRARDGSCLTWDVEHGAGTRTTQEDRLSPSQPVLQCGPEGLVVSDAVSGERLALWPQPVARARWTGDRELVGVLPDGELVFFEWMPAGSVGGEEGSKVERVPLPQTRRIPGPGRMHITPLNRLSPYQKVLLVGSAGRSDMLAAVPLLSHLKGQGKEVFLAGLVTGKKTSAQKRFVEVGGSQRKGARFEQLLAAELGQTVLCFPGGGPLHRLETFRDLLRYSGADALVLVEAGVETLMKGDEPSLGSAAEDLVSLAAAQQLELPCKMLVNLGMGIDRSKEVGLAYTLEAIAELTRVGGFFGSLTLLPGMPEFQALQRVTQALSGAAEIPPTRAGWAEAALAVAGGACGGDPYLSPLLNLLWFFDLDAVAARSRVLEWLQDKVTPLDVHRAITNFLTVTEPRPWLELPI